MIFYVHEYILRELDIASIIGVHAVDKGEREQSEILLFAKF